MRFNDEGMPVYRVQSDSEGLARIEVLLPADPVIPAAMTFMGDNLKNSSTAVVKSYLITEDESQHISTEVPCGESFPELEIQIFHDSNNNGNFDNQDVEINYNEYYPQNFTEILFVRIHNKIISNQNLKIKIKLKDMSLMGVSSSNEAFLASKIKPEWQDIEQIFQSVKAAVKREDFDLIIDSFYERGAIEKDVEKKRKVNETHFSLDGTQDIRDYGNITFNQRELEDVPELPLNLKKEILFLYYYGRNLDFYQVLNIPDGVDRSDDEVIFYAGRYRKIFATRNFEGIDLIHYVQKLEKVRKILKEAFVIEDPSIRKKYNLFLKARTGNGIKELKKDMPRRKTEKSKEYKICDMKKVIPKIFGPYFSS